MKKIKYISCLVLSLGIFTQLYISNLSAQVTTESVEFVAPLIGIEDVVVVPKGADALTVSPKIFSTYPQDRVEKIEISLTDTYSTETEDNRNVVKTISFNDISVNPGQSPASPYVVTFKNVPYREDYRIQVTLTNKDGLVDSVRQSAPFAFGNKSLLAFANVQIQKEYIAHEGQEIFPSEGPRIAKTGATTSDAVYTLQIKNSNAKQEVYVGARISYSKFNSNNTPQVVEIEEVTIKPNATGLVKIKPVIFSEPGTYVASVVLTYTIDNVTTTFDKTFRYMLGDLIINSVDFREINNQIVFDIVGANGNTSLEDFTEEELTEGANPLPTRNLVILASYRNANNQEIASTSQTVAYTIGTQEVVLPINVEQFKKDYGNMSSIAVTIKDGDIILQQKTTPFSLYVAPVDDNLNPVHVYTVMCIVLLIVYVCVRSHVGRGARRLMFWLLLLMILGSVYSYYKTVYAALGPSGESFWILKTSPTNAVKSYGSYPSSMWEKCLDHGYSALSLSKINHIAIPASTAQFTCGATTSIKVSASNATCANTGSATYFTPSVMTGLSFEGEKPLGKNKLVYKKGGVSTPMNITFDPTFTGTAVLKGTYYNRNGGCYSTTKEITYNFDVSSCVVPEQHDTCVCSGRDFKVCTNSLTGTTTKQNAGSQCSFSASCTAELVGDQGTFNIFTDHALGLLSYKFTGTGVRTGNPYTVTIPLGSTTTRNITVTDSYDNSTAVTSCTLVNNGTDTTCGGVGEPVCPCGGVGQPPCTETSTTTTASTTPPKIKSFMSQPHIVKKGQPCNYVWETEGFDSCALVVNKTNQPAGATNSTVQVSTTNGLNQLASLTCNKAAVGTSSPAVNLATTTVCTVNPEVQER